MCVLAEVLKIDIIDLLFFDKKVDDLTSTLTGFI